MCCIVITFPFSNASAIPVMYNSIRKNNNIPEDWTEKDFENQEMDNMIKSSYRLAIQDITHSGRVSQACVEYWEQLGIHPQVGEIETRLYMTGIAEALEKGNVITIQHMYFFLDAMSTKHQKDWNNVIKRIGLDSIGSERYMAESVRDINKENEMNDFYKEVSKYPIDKIICLDETSVGSHLHP